MLLILNTIAGCRRNFWTRVDASKLIKLRRLYLLIMFISTKSIPKFVATLICLQYEIKTYTFSIHNGGLQFRHSLVNIDNTNCTYIEAGLKSIFKGEYGVII